MAYLRWSWSPWYAYSHADGGDGDDAVLIAWHERGAGVSVTAGELVQAGCEGHPQRLHDFMAGRFRADDDKTTAALKDVGALGPAVDQFLFEIVNAGKIAMPDDVANRYRDLKRWIKEAINVPRRDQAQDSRGFPLWFGWWTEMDEIVRCYPPPRLSREIRDLLQVRALRVLRGEDVSPEQDALERATIAAACEWPRP